MKRKKKRPQESTRSRHQPPGQIGQPANPQEKKKGNNHGNNPFPAPKRGRMDGVGQQ